MPSASGNAKRSVPSRSRSHGHRARAHCDHAVDGSITGPVLRCFDLTTERVRREVQLIVTPGIDLDSESTTFVFKVRESDEKTLEPEAPVDSVTTARDFTPKLMECLHWPKICGRPWVAVEELRTRSGTEPAGRRCRRLPPGTRDDARRRSAWTSCPAARVAAARACRSRKRDLAAVSSSSRLIRFTIFVSTDCQWR